MVVSHVSPIKSAVSWALNTTMEIMFHCHLSQASLCRIDIGKFGPLLYSFNEQAVLPDTVASRSTDRDVDADEP